MTTGPVASRDAAARPPPRRPVSAPAETPAANHARQPDAVDRAAVPDEEESREIANERVKSAADALSLRLSDVKNRSVRYHMHDDTGQMFVDIVDDETDTVIRSIPPEESLDRLAMLEKYLGLLFDRKA